MNINDMINTNLIDLSYQADCKDEVLQHIATMVEDDQRIKSRDLYYQGLLEREEAFSTGVGLGIAIPHAKTDTVTSPCISFVKLQEKIEWGSLDDEPVDLVIGLAVPETGAGNTHLEILAKISTKIMEASFVEALRSAGNSSEVLSLIQGI